MDDDRIPHAFDEEHIIDSLIAELKALHKTIPEMLLALALAKAQANKNASRGA